MYSVLAVVTLLVLYGLFRRWRESRRRLRIIRGKCFYVIFKEPIYWHRWPPECLQVFVAVFAGEILSMDGSVIIGLNRDPSTLGEHEGVIHIVTQSYMIEDIACYNFEAEIAIASQPHFKLMKEERIESLLRRGIKVTPRRQCEILAERLLLAITLPAG